MLTLQETPVKLFPDKEAFYSQQEEVQCTVRDD